MPVIRYIPVDPFDLVIQGEMMRVAALNTTVFAGTPTWTPDEPMPLVQNSAMLADLSTWAPMADDFSFPREVLRNPFAATMIAANAVISTPCGALIPHFRAGIIVSSFVQGTESWTISGVTRDSTGAIVPDCKMIVLEVGQLAVTGTPVVAQMTSDGVGAYSVQVPRNTLYQVISYKVGAPDLAGISLNTIVPTQV